MEPDIPRRDEEQTDNSGLDPVSGYYKQDYRNRLAPGRVSQ